MLHQLLRGAFDRRKSGRIGARAASASVVNFLLQLGRPAGVARSCAVDLAVMLANVGKAIADMAAPALVRRGRPESQGDLSQLFPRG